MKSNKIYNSLKVTVLAFVALLASGTLEVSAQNSTVTPYSRFEIGRASCRERVLLIV